MAAKVTISGSYRKHFDRICEVRAEFLEAGADVLRPLSERVDAADEELVRLEGDPAEASEVAGKQLEAIDGCDLLYVVNPGGYLGPSATFEAGYATRAGIIVVTSESAFEPAVGAFTRAVGSPEVALELLGEEQG